MAMDNDSPSIGELIEQRLHRRDALRGLLGVGAVAAFSQIPLPAAAQETGPSSLTFKELAHTLDAQQHVAEGYDMQVVIRWGDPVVAGAPAFDPANLTADAQEKQFGYNNDYLGLYALPAGSRSGDRFLLVANHEYINSNLMFAGLGAGRDANLKTSKEQVEVEMAAVGGAVIEIARQDGAWKVVDGQQVRAPHQRQHADGHIRSGSRPRAAQDVGRSGGPQGAGHDQQLRRRQHAVGHLAHLRGEFRRLLRRRCLEAAAARNAEALWRRPRHRLWLVAPRRSFRPRQGAQRAQPFRLGGRDRSLRTRRAAGEAHRAGSLQARRLYLRAGQGRPGRPLQRRRRALRVCLQVRHRPAVECQRPGRQQGPAGRGHALRRALQCRRQGRVAAAGAGPGSADGGERLCQPGRRAREDATRRRPLEAHADGPAGRHRDQSGERPRLCRAHQQRHAQARAGRPRQSARHQRPRPYPRDRAQGRRPWQRRGRLVDLPARRQAGPGCRARATIAPRRTMAG